MAITQAICNTFKKEIFLAEHNLTVGQHDIKAALYTSAATLSKATTVYSATNEVSGTGYTAKGASLTNVTPVVSGDFAVCDFANVTWGSSTITARGALLFNDTHASDAAVMVLDFGSDKTSSNGDFTIQFPVADTSNAIMRLT